MSFHDPDGGWLGRLRFSRGVAGRVKQHLAEQGEAYFVLAVVGAFTAYAFFFAILKPFRSQLEFYVWGLAAALCLLITRRRPLLEGWMAWVVAFWLAAVGGTFASGGEYASWLTARDLLAGGVTGWLMVSAMHRGLARRQGVVWYLVVTISPLLALAMILQNIVFDLKGAAAGLDRSLVLPWLVGVQNTWNQKYHESWLLFLTWGAVVALAPRSWKRWLGAGLVLALCALAISTGYSRTGKLALLLSLAVFLGALWAPRLTRAALAVVVAGTLLLAPWGAAQLWKTVTQQTNREFNPHRGGRLVAWQYSSELIKQRPKLGWGLGAAKNIPGQRIGIDKAQDFLESPARIPDAWALNAPFPGGHPHSLPLLIWLETGYLGALLACGLIVHLFRELGRVRERSKHAALLALAATFFFTFALNYPAWETQIQMLVIMTCGLVSATAPTGGYSAVHSGERMRPSRGAVSATTGVARAEDPVKNWPHKWGFGPLTPAQLAISGIVVAFLLGALLLRPHEEEAASYRVPEGKLVGEQVIYFPGSIEAGRVKIDGSSNIRFRARDLVILSDGFTVGPNATLTIEVIKTP